MCAGMRAEQHEQVAMSPRWAWHPQSAGLRPFLCQLNTNDDKTPGMAEQQFGRSSRPRDDQAKERNPFNFPGTAYVSEKQLFTLLRQYLLGLNSMTVLS